MAQSLLGLDANGLTTEFFSLGALTTTARFSVTLGSAGVAPAWTAADMAIFQQASGTNACVQIFSGAANSGIYGFSSPTARNRGYLNYNHSTDLMTLSSSGDITLSVGATKKITIQTIYSSAVYTVATLPTGIAGARSFVSDALAPAFGAAVVGAGAVGVPVYHDGTSWKVG